MWLRICAFKLLECVNALPERLQRKGCSPLWLRMWWFNSFEHVNTLPQTLQLKGGSAVWTCICFFNVRACLNVPLHTKQVNLCSELWTCMSVSSWLLVSTLTRSLKHIDCVLLSDVCTSLLLLSEKLCCRSFVFSSICDCLLQAPVNKHSPDVAIQCPILKSTNISCRREWTAAYTRTRLWSVLGKLLLQRSAVSSCDR